MLGRPDEIPRLPPGLTRWTVRAWALLAAADALALDPDRCATLPGRVPRKGGPRLGKLNLRAVDLLADLLAWPRIPEGWGSTCDTAGCINPRHYGEKRGRPKTQV